MLWVTFSYSRQFFVVTFFAPLTIGSRTSPLCNLFFIQNRFEPRSLAHILIWQFSVRGLSLTLSLSLSLTLTYSLSLSLSLTYSLLSLSLTLFLFVQAAQMSNCLTQSITDLSTTSEMNHNVKSDMKWILLSAFPPYKSKWIFSKLPVFTSW